MTDHPRSAWTEPGYPITGPAPRAATTQSVVHYSGSDNIPGDKFGWLRAMQRDYVDNRNYSLGYWHLVDQEGNSYQIRGRDFNSAANAGRKVEGNANNWTHPILFANKTDEPLSDAAIATAKRLWAETGITVRPIPHSEMDYTLCCGDVVRAQIAAGLLDPRQPEEPVMAKEFVWRHRDQPGAYFVSSGSVVHLDAFMRDAYLADGVLEVVSTNDTVADSYRAVAQGLPR